MDRDDLEGAGAMLATAIAITPSNPTIPQADAAIGAMRGRGRDTVIIGRVRMGSPAYPALSAGRSAFFQPRFS